MKLDRNINPDGSGKYALVNMRKVRSLPGGESPPNKADSASRALVDLRNLGCLTMGDESPGDQFFVLKYKDRFAAAALRAYADAVETYAHDVEDAKLYHELREWAREVDREAAKAGMGTHIPD